MKRIATKLLGLALMLAIGSGAFAADYGNQQKRAMPYSDGISLGDEWGIEGREARAPRACDDPKILASIVERFAWAEKKTWHRGFTIAEIRHPIVRKQPFSRVSYVPRRYCQATAVMTNQHQRKVYYMIGVELGFASIGDGVSFCLPGLDPWHVYGAACSTVR